MIEEFARRSVRSEAGGELKHLTTRELEVLELLARRLSNAEIAERFVVGERTVKTHVASVLRKLGVRDRVHAAIYAYESHLIEPGVA